MPIPQDIQFLVGWAGEPALERLIGNGARCKILLPQNIQFLVGWAGEPALERLIGNGARCKILQTWFEYCFYFVQGLPHWRTRIV
jgi:hypothetical protein